MTRQHMPADAAGQDEVGSEEVSHASVTLPLYLRVALWALQESRPVCRDDIVLAFQTTPRRASELMTYITSHGHRLIDARRGVIRDRGVSGVAVLEVTAVHMDRYNPVVNRSRGGRRRPLVTGAPPTLRDLALGRRSSGGAS